MSKPFYIITNRREAFVNLLEQIDAAESSIRICTYFWLDGEVSDIILQRLWVASCRGIQVDIFIDGKASLVAKSKKLMSLANSVNIYKYHGKNFLHSKMWLFDDKNLVVTSANISDKNYTPHTDLLVMTNNDTFLPDISTKLANKVKQAFNYYKIKSTFVRLGKNDDRYVPKSIENYEELKRIFRKAIIREYTKSDFFYKKPDIIKVMYQLFRKPFPQILCGYTNYKLLKKYARDNIFMLHTSSLTKLNFADTLYTLFNRIHKIHPGMVEYYIGKVHAKTYLSDDDYITGSYNLDLLSKYNEEILLKLNY